MNIVVSCSTSEGFGRTLIEAILLKIPIIHTNTGTPKEIFKNYENGLAYKLYDELNLSDKIIYTIENIVETKKRVEKAYSYVNNYFTEERYSKPILDALFNNSEAIFYRKEKYVTNLVLFGSFNIIKRKRNYLFEILNDIHIKTIFFGASSVLQKALDNLSKYNIYPDYICDNDLNKVGKKISSYKIYLPEDILNKNNKYMVIITSSYINEIRKQLLKYNNIILIESYWDIFGTCSFDLEKNEYILEELRK